MSEMTRVDLAKLLDMQAEAIGKDAPGLIRALDALLQVRDEVDMSIAASTRVEEILDYFKSADVFTNDDGPEEAVKCVEHLVAELRDAAQRMM